MLEQFLPKFLQTYLDKINVLEKRISELETLRYLPVVPPIVTPMWSDNTDFRGSD